MSRERDDNSVPATILQNYANGRILQNYSSGRSTYDQLYPPGTGNAYGFNRWQQTIPQYAPQRVTLEDIAPTYPDQFSSPEVPVPPDYYDPRTDQVSGIYDLQRPPHIPVYLPFAGETVAPGDYDYSKPLFQNADYNSAMLERSAFDLLDYLNRKAVKPTVDFFTGEGFWGPPGRQPRDMFHSFTHDFWGPPGRQPMDMLRWWGNNLREPYDWLQRQPYYRGMMDIPLNPEERKRYESRRE